jgi:hypothetical protein
VLPAIVYSMLCFCLSRFFLPSTSQCGPHSRFPCPLLDFFNVFSRCLLFLFAHCVGVVSGVVFPLMLVLLVLLLMLSLVILLLIMLLLCFLYVNSATTPQPPWPKT